MKPYLLKSPRRSLFRAAAFLRGKRSESSLSHGEFVPVSLGKEGPARRRERIP